MCNEHGSLHRPMHYESHVMPPAWYLLHIRLNNGGHLSWGEGPSLSELLELSEREGGLRNSAAFLTSGEVTSILCCLVGNPRRLP